MIFIFLFLQAFAYGFDEPTFEILNDEEKAKFFEEFEEAGVIAPRRAGLWMPNLSYRYRLPSLSSLDQGVFSLFDEGIEDQILFYRNNFLQNDDHPWKENYDHSMVFKVPESKRYRILVLGFSTVYKKPTHLLIDVIKNGHQLDLADFKETFEFTPILSEAYSSEIKAHFVPIHAKLTEIPPQPNFIRGPSVLRKFMETRHYFGTYSQLPVVGKQSIKIIPQGIEDNWVLEVFHQTTPESDFIKIGEVSADQLFVLRDQNYGYFFYGLGSSPLQETTYFYGNVSFTGELRTLAISPNWKLSSVDPEFKSLLLGAPSVFDVVSGFTVHHLQLQ